jgi:hypothetical protein
VSKQFKIVGQDLSDGYHTFDELYEHRNMLFLSLCLSMRHDAWMTEPSEGWFVVFLELITGQISYHIPEKYYGRLLGRIGVDKDYKWDGHTSADAVNRLDQLVGGFA